jgi:hypothetical protein
MANTQNRQGAAGSISDITDQAREAVDNLRQQASHTYESLRDNVSAARDKAYETRDQALDLYERIPKPISPKVHAFLDYGVTAYFLAVAAESFRNENKAAGIAALVNGAMVGGMSAITDYPGGINPMISFETHGIMDVVQGIFAGLAPMLMGFSDTDEAKYFYMQAVNEAAVVALTDFTAVSRERGEYYDEDIEAAA